MKRIIGIILLLLVLTNLGYAEEEWASSVQQTTDGGYIIVGIGEGDIKHSYDDVSWMLKTDSNGNKEWNITIDGGSGRNCAYSVQQTSDRGYIIAGVKVEYNDEHLWFMKTDSNGRKEWDKIFKNGAMSVANSIQQTTDGGYIIAGGTFPIDKFNSNVWLIKTDSNGRKEWEKIFKNGDSSVAKSFQQTTDGGYIIAGHTTTRTTSTKSRSNAWFIKTDSNGNKQWEKILGEDDSNEGAYSVQQTTDGGYIFGIDALDLKEKSGVGEYNWNVWIVKADANGNTQWEKTFGEEAMNRVKSVKQTEDGGYVIAGNTEPWGMGIPPVMDAWLLKTDSNGNMQWEKTFGGEVGNWVESVKQTIDGGYILAGSMDLFDGGDRDVWLVKTDSNGNTQWDKTFKLRDKPAAKDVTTTTSQQNKTTLIFGSIAILIGLVLLVSKSSRKKQGTSIPTSPTPIPTSLPVSHATQEAADRKQKRMEMQRLTELRNDASSKLKRAKGMLNKAEQLGIEMSQLEDIFDKAEQAFQKENYTHTIDYIKNYLTLIDQAEKNKKQLEQMRKSASEQIKSAKFSIEKAEKIGVTVQHARELKTKAKSAFDANDYNSAIIYSNKSRGAAEQFIDESKPSISIELPPKMQYDAWKHRDLIVTNKGTAHAVAITITFLTALEMRDLKIIERLDAGEQKTINVNIKPTEKGDVPVDYIVEFKNLLDRVYKTEDTAIIQISTDIETTEESVTSPSEKVMTDSNKLDVLREHEFFNGFSRLKISIQNNMQYTATDVLLDLDYDENILRLDHHEPNTYFIKKGRIQLGNIPPNSDKTIALYFDPLICSTKGTVINCRIDYKDAFGIPHSVRMKPSKNPNPCPLLKTEQDINIGRLKELVASLSAKSSRLFSMPSGVNVNKAVTLCQEVIQMHDVRHVRTFKTTDDKTYEIWYYGKTKVEMIDLVIKASVSEETEIIEVFVAAPSQKVLTGLLAELGRNISKRGESLGKLAPVFNVSIKDSQIIRSNLLGACDINGICDGNVVIEDSSVRRSSIANNANNVSIHIKDSNVERSTIGAGTKKCPECGIEVADEQKFCLECGAKL